MNEIKIAEFVALTEAYLRVNRAHLDQTELDHVDQLYDDLAAELDRRNLFDDLYD